MPLEEGILKNPVITLDVGMFQKLEGAKGGMPGKGSFEFKVINDESAGMVQIELINLQLETENAADKDLKALTDQDERALPESVNEEDNDDI